MKTRFIFTVILALSSVLCALSQIPQGFNYQAIARDATGNPIKNIAMPVRITIQSDPTGTTIFWQELHSSVTTNDFGMITLVVGQGTREAGTAATFADIDWSVTPKYIKTEIDYNGWKEMGVSQLWAVPYSMAAEELTGSVKKLTVVGETTNMEEPLFEVKNKNGQTVFAVYNEGVRAYIGDGEAKGKKGGFAIGSFDTSKGEVELFIVTADSIRAYIDNSGSKIKKGGFAIGGFDSSKGYTDEYLRITPDSTTIATSNQSRKVTVNNPDLDVPLLNINGSIKMGTDPSETPGSINFDGTKFFTYEGNTKGGKGDEQKQFVVTGAPMVSTASVSDISRSSAVVSGIVLDDGGSEVVARGVCWSTTSLPTLLNSSVTAGSGTGSFSAKITGLNGSTTYYARAYATNSQFTNYGDEIMFTTLPPVLPAVVTSPVTSVTTTSATSGGKITDDGAAPITARGVCWNTTGNPTVDDNFTSDGTGSGEFISNLQSLTANQTYFVRAYATNSVGTAYGDEYSFTTSDLPVLSTSPVTAVTDSSAVTGGNIYASGELAILQRGVCWNTTGNPTIEDAHTENGPGTGLFTSVITGLKRGTTYFVRAYATNSSGTAYGNEYFFTTLNVPTVSTGAVSMVTGSSATCGGNVLYNGGAVVTARGLCWNTTGNPTIADSYITVGSGTGTFSEQITGLTIGTTYYVRAFATNKIGTAYGEEKMFTTQNYATVITSEVTDITYTTAMGGGNITSDGGALITQRGVCWSTNPNPTLADNHTEDGTGTGVFTSKITGLTANKTYYVRAYAINSIGTVYGNEVSFSTPTIVPPEPGLAVIATIKIVTGTDGYHTGGYISSDGGSPVTQRGVCWSTSPNPTISDEHTVDGNGTGLFNSLITSLSGCGVTYYVRAYATNSLGTSYGNEYTVLSGLLPLVESTAAITDITKTSAVSGGTITSDGGCEITERGICWSRRPNPTINDFKAASGSGTGTFTATMTGLYPNDTYYVRAYATNSRGTTYGPELSFTTQAGTLGLKIGQFYAGGYIYYLDETGDHGLVCSPEDNGIAPWGCVGIEIPGLLEDIGTGAINTAIIIANCSEEGIAARVCDNLELNGYTDWFLPSIEELLLMYYNLNLSGIGNFSNEYDVYWSSSSTDSYFCFALILRFSSGSVEPLTRFTPTNIRASRAF